MDIAWWRDLAIIILGFITIIALASVSLIVFLLYKRLIPLIDSTNEAIHNVNTILSYTQKEVMQPVIQFGAVVQGVVQVVSLISELFRKKEDSDE